MSNYTFCHIMHSMHCSINIHNDRIIIFRFSDMAMLIGHNRSPPVLPHF